MYKANYTFCDDLKEDDSIAVSPSNLYSTESGYGFIVEENRKAEELLQIAELNSSFNTVYWYQGENLTALSGDGKGCYLDKDSDTLKRLGCTKADIPMIFKAKVPSQGNYKVTVRIDTKEVSIENLLIFTGRRRLAYRGRIGINESFEKSFTINVCDIIPRGKESVYEDQTIDIAICGSNPRITSLLIEEISIGAIPTLYIAGDSTVTDQGADYPYIPGASYCGWGQMLSVYLKNGVAVSNHAHSGLTTESFRSEGHYEIVKKYIRPGDYFFIQFAHNDQKLDHLKAEEGYKENMIRYINEIRELGAFPVIVTPLARNSWKGMDGTYNDLLEDYGVACHKIGQEMNIPVVDLHVRSMSFVKNLGLEEAKSYFYPLDYTHNNDFGGYLMAGFVVNEYKELCSADWAKEYKVLGDLFDLSKEAWIPLQKTMPPKPPKEYIHIMNPNAPKSTLEDLERPEDILTRTEALDMVIKAARFFPTNVYNDMFEDVIGHEWFAGTIECAYQNGVIPPELVDNRKFYPEKQVTAEEFICFCMNGYKSRQQLPKSVSCALDSKASTWAIELVRAAYVLGLISEETDLKALILRKDAAKICVKMGI